MTDGRPDRRSRRASTASADYLAAVVGDADPAPRYGDDDEGFALRLGPEPRPTVRDHLGVGCRADRQPAARRRAPRTLAAAWVGTIPGRVDASAPARQPRPGAASCAPHGGLVVLRSAGRRMTMDVGPLGYLAIAAHGHADALAVTVEPGRSRRHRAIRGRRATTGTRSGDRSIAAPGRTPTVTRGRRGPVGVRWSLPVDAPRPGPRARSSTWTGGSSTRSTTATGGSPTRSRTADGCWPLRTTRRSSSSTRSREPASTRCGPRGRCTRIWTSPSAPGPHGHAERHPGPPDPDRRGARRDHRPGRGDGESHLGWWSDRLESRVPSWLVGGTARGAAPLVMATVLCPRGGRGHRRRPVRVAAREPPSPPPGASDRNVGRPSSTARVRGG